MSATQKLLRFGVFELNLDTEELCRGETALKLSPQPLQLLALLASHAGKVVSREEIQRQLWSEDSEVDFEHGVTQCIKQIRTALGDNANHPRYIETIHRQGYRFIAPVDAKTVPVPGPRLVESDSGERTRLPVVIAGKTDASAAVAGALAPSYSAAVPEVKAEAPPAPEVTDIEKSRSRVWRIRSLWIPVAVLLIGLIGGGLYWRAHKAPVLTEKDTIVLADFDNKTGDSVFDGTLRQGLWADLEQSPFLNMLSDRRIAQTMTLMAQAKGAALTAELAREVCVRTGSAATLEGAIAMLGTDYVVGLKAVNCRTGEEMAVEQFTVDNKEKILPALGKAASQIRRKLGESLASVQKYDVPLPEATTPSLEALKAYSLGHKAKYTKGNTAAVAFYERAIELDPNFAMAYAGLSIVYGNLSEHARAAENARKAYELRDRVSQRERFAIQANYYKSVTGELEKTVTTYELWEQTYPRDSVPYANSADIYGCLGSWEKALAQAQEAMRLEPNNTNSYVNLGGSFMSLNRLDEAEAVYRLAEEHKLQGEFLTVSRYLLAYLKGDTAQMAQFAAAAMEKPGTEDLLLAVQADTEASYGKFRQAHNLTQRAVDSAHRNDAKETGAIYLVFAALREVESGNLEPARAAAEGAVKLAPNRDVRAMAALALARAGDTAKAQKLADELDKASPLDTLVQTYWLPTIRAAIALRRKDPIRAVELLHVTSTIELSQPTTLTISLFPAYLRGEAYLMLHDGSAAAAEFRKFIDHCGLVGNFPWGALARLGLARAYALDVAKDPAAREKARTAYQNFLTLWKDADPDIPIYKQAKAEYAALR